MIFRLALASLLARSLTVSMTVLAIALSVALFLGVEKVRTGARASFADTISGTDLIVGARSGSIQLLLYSVFRIGQQTNNLSWESYGEIAARPDIDWIVPISLGDSHRQFRVMGTTNAFFDHYKFRGDRSLRFQMGNGLVGLYDAVIGQDVAAALNYSVGDPILVSHGLASFTAHRDHPFRVSGILAKTGTPVDRTVIVSLEAIEAIHAGLEAPGSPARERSDDLTPTAITAAFVGVKSRLQLLQLQRSINNYPGEPLLAILPGVALQELWQVVGLAESALIAVSGMIVVTTLIGMMAMIFSSLNERRREMAIWRAMGARPATILGLLVCEAALMAAIGAFLGAALLYLVLTLAQGWIDSRFGLWLEITPPNAREIGVLVATVCAAVLASAVPAARAYRMSLADGMSVKI